MVMSMFLRGGIRFLQSVCLCIVLYLVLRIRNDHVEYQEGRNLLWSMHTNNITEYTTQNILQTRYRNKYYEWIPDPEQTIASLSANPYVIQNNDVCRVSDNMDLIFLIKSAAENFEKRQGIRRTWGNVTRLQTQYEMQVVFLLGLTQKEDMQMKIMKEDEKNQDIVQGNFVDTYHNLTHKSVLGLRWVSEFCSKARRVIIVDDDVFIDTVKLFSDYKTMVYNETDSIHCYWKPANTIPIQRTSGKWKVNVKEFKNLTYYPLSYCIGFFVMLSPGIASKFYKYANEVPFFWIEDFYVFGMLTDRTGSNQNISDVSGIVSLNKYNSLHCFGQADKKCNLLVGHAPSPEVMVLMWEKMLIQNRNLSFTVLAE